MLKPLLAEANTSSLQARPALRRAACLETLQVASSQESGGLDLGGGKRGGSECQGGGDDVDGLEELHFDGCLLACWKDVRVLCVCGGGWEV